MHRFSLTLLCVLVACDDGSTPEAAFTGRFEIEISNLSDAASLTSGFAPGAWVLHHDPDPFFTEGQPDRGDGLEALAEDGAPALFAQGAVAQGFFSASGGEDYVDAPLHPGETMRFEVEVDPADPPRLNLAMMLGESNDRFLAPTGAGIALFDGDGAPITEQDVSDQLIAWDAGTEVDQPLGEGPDQAPRQTVSGQGRTEGVVAPTREPPPAATVTVVGGGVEIHCPDAATLLWIMHGEEFAPVEAYAPAPSGLLSLTETGATDALLADWPVATLLVGAQDGETPATAPIDPSRPYLSLVARLPDAPDRFVMSAPVLLVEDGAIRSADAIAADFDAALKVWSVGPEPAVVRRVDDADWPAVDQLVRVVIRAR